MSNENYLPDPDHKFEWDYSNKNVTITFYSETKLEIDNDDVAREIQAAVAAKQYTLAYGLLYGYAQREFDGDGQGHAMVQAAFDIIHKDQDAALRYKQIPKGGVKSY